MRKFVEVLNTATGKTRCTLIPHDDISLIEVEINILKVTVRATAGTFVMSFWGENPTKMIKYIDSLLEGQEAWGTAIRKRL